MEYTDIIIVFENGQRQIFKVRDFEYFAPINELEHKRENIIINLVTPSKSFKYECNDTGEIIFKESITVFFK